MSLAFKQSQQGAALIVSLLFLLVLTILGISSLSNSGMEARMAHNFQLSNTVFHAAETSIDTIISKGDRGNPAYTEASDEIQQVAPIPGNTSPVIPLGDADLDPSDSLGAAAQLTSNSTITFIRQRAPCKTAQACFEYAITSTASINGTSASTTHTQIVEYEVPPGAAN